MKASEFKQDDLARYTPKVGDTVRYELDLDGEPRWDRGTDSGPTGKFEKSKVVEIYKDEYFMLRPPKVGWWVPLPSHRSFVPNRPGWPEKEIKNESK